MPAAVLFLLLPHAFCRPMHLQEITRSRYSPTIRFEDPITSYNNIDGYVFNINLLRVSSVALHAF